MQRHPLHTLLLSADWSWRTVYRWLLAHWYYRMSGLACWIADCNEIEFWDRMLAAAHVETATSPLGAAWPRGDGRESFHSSKAITALGENKYIWGDQPEDMVRTFLNAAPTYSKLIRRVIANKTFAEKDALVIGVDLVALDLCHFDFPPLCCLETAYRSKSINQLHSELEPWISHSNLAAELIHILRKEHHERG